LAKKTENSACYFREFCTNSAHYCKPILPRQVISGSSFDVACGCCGHCRRCWR